MVISSSNNYYKYGNWNNNNTLKKRHFFILHCNTIFHLILGFIVCLIFIILWCLTRQHILTHSVKKVCNVCEWRYKLYHGTSCHRIKESVLRFQTFTVFSCVGLCTYQDHMTSRDVHVGMGGLFTPGGGASACRGAWHWALTQLRWHTIYTRRMNRVRLLYRRLYCHSLSTQFLGRKRWKSQINQINNVKQIALHTHTHTHTRAHKRTRTHTHVRPLVPGR